MAQPTSPHTPITIVPNDGELSPSPTGTPHLPITLQPFQKKRASKHTKVFRIFRTVLHSFPILTPACRLNNPVPRGSSTSDGHIHGATRITGTLFGHRKARITLAFQDNPRGMPILQLELAIPTARFMHDMGLGLTRVALECEKKAADKTRILEEPLWTAFINGRKIGYAAKREPSDSDLDIMKLLHAVSMGAGVLPGHLTDPVDGEMTYLRAHFDRVAGNKHSETFYMLNPDGNSGPELSIFFLRI